MTNTPSMEKAKLKFVIAGGGTGGHIFPAIAIANAIKKRMPDVDFLFIGAKGKMEMEKVPQAGYKIVGLDIAGFNRSSLIKNINLPIKLVKSYYQVKKIFKTFKPTAAIGVGGYSSFPVLRYAQKKQIPTFIHESNSFAGKSNMLLGKKAVKIFVATDGMEKFFPKEKIKITGNPVRAAIINNNLTKEEALKFFGLNEHQTTILSIGGSLGAKSINDAIAKDLQLLGDAKLQIIWQTGKLFAGQAKLATDGKSYVWTNDFITQMEYAYAAADIVISRSGAMAITELAVVKKPVIFVPYPFAAEDHQTVNAQNLVNKNAGILVKDSEALHALIPTVITLSKDKVRQEELKTNIGKLGVTNADDQIAAQILELV